MAQLLVHIADTGDHKTDAFINTRRFKVGDIVDIFPDDHVFGRLDIGPHVKLVSVPGIDKSEISHLTGRDFSMLPDSEFISRARIWRLKNIPDSFSSLDELLSSVEQKPVVPVTNDSN